MLSVFTHVLNIKLRMYEFNIYYLYFIYKYKKSPPFQRKIKSY